MENFTHTSVLLTEAVEALNIKASGTYVDATFGRGGHSKAILSNLDNEGQLIAIDRDPEAQKYAKEVFSEFSNFHFFSGRMSNLDDALTHFEVEKVDGVLMDIGVSSPQLDDAQRGFSFMQEGPLDMRMDPSNGVSAEEWVNNSDYAEMVTVFRTYGEEKFASKIANKIIYEREKQLITTTKQLAEIISSAVPFKDKHKHPATRCFQAIRIAVNEELKELEETLEVAYRHIKSGGRLVVISFHSLEDRIVKQFINQYAKPKDQFPDLPIACAVTAPTMKITYKPIKASAQECEKNPRARSAIMRVAEKI